MKFVLKLIRRAILFAAAAAILGMLSASALQTALSGRVLSREDAGDLYDGVFERLVELNDPAAEAKNIAEQYTYLTPIERYTMIEDYIGTELPELPASLIQADELPKNGSELFLAWYEETENYAELMETLESVMPLPIMTLEELSGTQTALFESLAEEYAEQLRACVDESSDNPTQFEWYKDDIYWEIDRLENSNQLPPNGKILFDEWFAGTELGAELERRLNETLFDSEKSYLDQYFSNYYQVRQLGTVLAPYTIEGMELYIDLMLEELSRQTTLLRSPILCGDVEQKVRLWFCQSEYYEPVERLMQTKQTSRTAFAAGGDTARYLVCDAEAYASPSVDAAIVGVIPAGTKVKQISNEESYWILIEWNGQRVFVLERNIEEKEPYKAKAGSEQTAEIREGEYAKYRDQLANLPDYAADFYDWLVENAVTSPDADSPLINPQKGTVPITGSDRGYPVASTTGRVHFTFNAASGSAGAHEAAADAIAADIDDFTNAVYYNMNSAYAAFKSDYPQVFWLRDFCGSYQYYSWQLTNVNYAAGTADASYTATFYYWTVGSDYDCRHPMYRNVNTILSTIDQVNAAVERAMSGYPRTADRLEQVRYLNRWVTEHCFYNLNVTTRDENANECTGALLGMSGTSAAVCESYAQALKVLCDRAGIPCITVTGYSFTSRGDDVTYHEWNLIQMEDGRWYACDPTWCDPIADETLKSGRESEKYLLLGAGSVTEYGLRFDRTHVITNNLYFGDIPFPGIPTLSEKAYEFDRGGTSEPDIWWRE